MEYQIYKSKYTGKHVDDAIDQIPNKLDKQTAQTESDQVYGKLADGSQTMFDVTMGATATTIPRRDTAGRIQVADGVSGNDAVNFNQLNSSTTMYRHSISYLGTSDESVTVQIYLTVISSTNLVVDSLSALKVLIGNTFTYSATGAVLKTSQQELYQVVAITDTQVKTISNSGFIDINYPTGRWSDDVITV